MHFHFNISLRKKTLIPKDSLAFENENVMMGVFQKGY